ncbi:hypothetical protein BDN71DRAFT_1513041 [Pleurotus eryngii]|uniref:Uncharacterized protein n=1 Tax=Pleurotus eryngii TaxID=5323 RepID=A0A9P6DA99_PLEER|nr:hypothetical protein BDN71DRAFT_1513041 [Pleurotus eryngii]
MPKTSVIGIPAPQNMQPPSQPKPLNSRPGSLNDRVLTIRLKILSHVVPAARSNAQVVRGNVVEGATTQPSRSVSTWYVMISVSILFGLTQASCLDELSDHTATRPMMATCAQPKRCLLANYVRREAVFLTDYLQDAMVTPSPTCDSNADEVEIIQAPPSHRTRFFAHRPRYHHLAAPAIRATPVRKIIGFKPVLPSQSSVHRRGEVKSKPQKLQNF